MSGSAATQQYQRTRVIANRFWSDSLCSLQLVQTQPLCFTPGQYTRLAMQQQGELIARPYSIVSSPGAAELEFFVIVVDDGPLSHYLYSLEPGDELLVEKHANGFLVLEETRPAEQLWLLATGTGVAPFVSILRHGQVFDRHRHVVLAQSVRHANELAYADELTSLAERCSGFSYVQLVTRSPQLPRGVLHGRITQALTNGSLEQAAGLRISQQHSHVMLCGNPQMIDDCIGLLGERGLRRHRRRAPGHISVEKFW